MDAVLQDLRYAARSLRRQPAFALLAVGTLALGIGANAAIFSVVNAVLLRPLAYSQPERIVAINNLWRKSGVSATVSAPDFHDWHDTTSSFDDMAYYAGGETSVSTAGVADYGSTIRVTPGFFRVFGVGAELGRALEAPDEVAGSAFTAVIGHEFWMRRFGGRPDAVGATVSFAGRTFTIVGVMPSGFRFPARSDIWYPAWVQPETTSRGAHNYRVVARLKDGVSRRSGAGGNDGRRCPARTRVSGLERRQGRDRRAAAGAAGRRYASDAEHAGRRCRAGAADCVRQRREPSARARDVESE